MFKRLFQSSDAQPVLPRPTCSWLISLNLPPVPITAKRSVRIGRKASCDFVINDKRVSREHAEVFHKNGALWIRDLGSHNGTIVDGERISSVCRLKVGCKIQLHDYSFLVSDAPTEFPEQLSTHYGAQTYTSCGEVTESSFRGSLDHLDLATILQTLDASGQTGILKIRSDGGEGRIGVRVGQPVWANFGEHHDEKAVLAMVRLREGEFVFGTDNPGIQREIKQSLTCMLLEAARSLDEATTS